MSWIERVRQKSRPEKLRIMIMITLSVVGLLVIWWAVTAKYLPAHKADTSLFKTFGNSIKNFKLEKPTNIQ